MKTLAIVPARGGSKGIIRKNLQLLAGKPLLAWTMEAIIDSALVDRVVVSTDDPEIAQAARFWGAETPFMRPTELAADHIHSVQVVLHALNWLERRENYRPDAAMMLLPTSPFRKATHIDGALTLFQEENPEAVISVCELTKPLHGIRKLRDGRLAPIDHYDNLNLQRQDVETLYAVNGSIYISRPETLEHYQTFHSSGAIPYFMPGINSLDINSSEDMFIAEAVARSWYFEGIFPNAWSNPDFAPPIREPEQRRLMGFPEMIAERKGH